jgi:peptide/nickel transport system permease protein
MIAYIIRRVLMLVPTLLAVTVGSFLILHLIPGDPARVMAGLEASEEIVESLRHRLGLDKPIYVQYAIFLKNISKLNFGESIRSQDAVIKQILPRFKNTLILSLVSISISTLIGILAGVLASVRQNTITDYTITTLVLLGISAPSFWLGLLLILFFSVFLGIFPAGGMLEIKSIVLPAITLAGGASAMTARMMRSSMLETLRMDYIKAARAKGQREYKVIFKHALKNALMPTITIVGIQFGYLMGGSVLVETVFSWPGLGWLTVDAIFAKDYPVVQACVLFFAFSFVFVNLAVDVVYAYISPKMTYD